jgi:tetratricopeptide (TPR) repeat protein
MSNLVLIKMKKLPLVISLSFILAFSHCAVRTQKEGVTETSPVLDEARRNSAQGLFQESIDAYNAALQQDPENKAIINEYIQVLENIKKSAEKEFAEGHYRPANDLYYFLSKNYSGFESFHERLSFDLQSVRLEMRACMIKHTDKEADNAFRAKDYRGAIQEYRNAFEAYPGDSYLLTRLDRMARRIYAAAKSMLDRKSYTEAGKISYFLLNEYTRLQEEGLSLSFTESMLEEIRKPCVSQLTKKGLYLYRHEKIEPAVAVWKEILEFDPDNTEIIKAITNAEDQLSRIKKKRNRMHTYS